MINRRQFVFPVFAAIAVLCLAFSSASGAQTESGEQPKTAVETDGEAQPPEDSKPADIAIRFALDREFDGLSAPFLAALKKDYYGSERLDVTIVSASGAREVIQRVAAGTDQLGFADLNALIGFRNRNPKSGVRAIMMAYDIAPFAIIGRKSLGVSKLSDLEGKALAIVPPDDTFALWPYFAGLNNIDVSKIRIESVGYPLRELLLAQDRVAGVLGYSLTSYINLKSAGIAEDDISVILMSENGLELYGNAIIVNPNFAKRQPDAVKGFVKATLRGFQDVIADPAGNIEPVLDRNADGRRAVELERLQMAVNNNIVTDWVRANGLGGVDMKRLERSIDQLAVAYAHQNRIKAADIFTDAYLPPAETRKLR